ncbi:MAG: glycosyltransferase, partial [Treponema sp.]|nr:glycosyltransferase [Treponema sp.]
ADIIALLDEKTKAGLTGKRTGYEHIVSGTEIIPVPEEFSQKESSRWIKTSIRQYVSGDFLFIDCDTIITERLDTSFPQDIHIGAVLDTHVPLSKHHLYEYFQQEDKRLGFCSSLQNDCRYNGGLIFCRDSPDGIAFFERWHDLWLESRKKGCSQDMPSLNQANYELNNIIAELGGEWNCQISHNGLPYLHNAKIIHYYATSLVSFTPPYMLAADEILLSIKESGIISPEVMKMIENPKTAFSAKTRIIADQIALDVLESAFFSKLLWLRRQHQKSFNTLNSFVAGIKKPKRNRKTNAK